MAMQKLLEEKVAIQEFQSSQFVHTGTTTISSDRDLGGCLQGIDSMHMLAFK